MKINKSNITITILSIVIAGLLIFMIAGPTKTTGESIFDFLRTKPTTTTTVPTVEYKGLLASKITDIRAIDFKGYEVAYDADGDLLHEITKNGAEFELGPDYRFEGNNIVSNTRAKPKPVITSLSCTPCSSDYSGQSCTGATSGNTFSCSGTVECSPCRVVKNYGSIATPTGTYVEATLKPAELTRK